MTGRATSNREASILEWLRNAPPGAVLLILVAAYGIFAFGALVEMWLA